MLPNCSERITIRERFQRGTCNQLTWRRCTWPAFLSKTPGGAGSCLSYLTPPSGRPERLRSWTFQISLGFVVVDRRVATGQSFVIRQKKYSAKQSKQRTHRRIGRTPIKGSNFSKTQKYKMIFKYFILDVRQIWTRNDQSRTTQTQRKNRKSRISGAQGKSGFFRVDWSSK